MEQAAAAAFTTDGRRSRGRRGSAPLPAQPADRDGAEQPKRMRMRIRNGKSGDARRRNDD
eukprot:508037-Prymnesium_polylepis.1